MKSFSKLFSAVAAIGLLAGTAAAADDTVSAGKVKSTNPDKKSFVLTDAAGKDHTVQFGDPLVFNRGGREGKTDLNVGDKVNVCHDTGASTWTAHYILIQEGDTMNSTLVRGAVKSYDGATKQLSFTDDNAKTWMFPKSEASVRLNGQPSKIEDIRSGDSALIIVDTTGTTVALRNVMVTRK
jgi:hypothetical protein